MAGKTFRGENRVEWLREVKENPVAQKCYLNLLREWFKNNSFTPQVAAAAYMTGILLLKKDGSQSAEMPSLLVAAKYRARNHLTNDSFPHHTA